MNVRKFLNGFWAGKKRFNLTDYIDPVQELPVVRRRKEYAMSMLQDPCYNDAIRMMREQILDEMSECDPLDKETLGMLRLRLQTVNEFSLTLAQFIDAYEELVALQREEQRKYHNQEAAA